MSLPPRCVRPVTACGAACLSHINGRSGWRPSSTPIASITCPRLGSSALTKRLETASLSGSYDHLLGAVERHLVKAAKQPHAPTLDRLQTGPGIGTILRLVLRDEMHAIQRFPRVQACISYGRLVQGAKASAGQRSGTSGTKSGHASLKWAFSEAAVWCLRAHPTGQALTVLAQQLARAVYDMLRRGPGCTLDTLLHGYGRGAGEPAASRGHDGTSRATVLGHDLSTASTNAPEHRGALSSPGACDWTPAPRLSRRRASLMGAGCCPSPEPRTHWRINMCRLSFE